MIGINRMEYWLNTLHAIYIPNLPTSMVYLLQETLESEGRSSIARPFSIPAINQIQFLAWQLVLPKFSGHLPHLTISFPENILVSRSIGVFDLLIVN